MKPVGILAFLSFIFFSMFVLGASVPDPVMVEDGVYVSTDVDCKTFSDVVLDVEQFTPILLRNEIAVELYKSASNYVICSKASKCNLAILSIEYRNKSNTSTKGFLDKHKKAFKLECNKHPKL